MSAPTAAPALHCTLGLWGTTVSGVGIILGAGIYVLIGAAAADAGGALWASFLIAALLAGATGLSYAELAAMFPEAGGSSAFAREAFGRRAGFLVGWLLLTMVVLAAAAVAIGFGGYVDDLLGPDVRPSAALLIAACAVVVWIGVRETVAIAVVFTALEAAGLVLAIVVGLPHLGPGALVDTPRGASGIIAAASLAFFAFTGFEQMATLAEETRDPVRTIPRAMLLAIVITTTLYLLVAVTAVAVIPWPELAGDPAPLADVVRRAASDRLGDGLSVIALFATANTVLMLLATGARLVWGMARRALLPPPFGWLHARRGTPWFATGAVSATAIAFARSRDIGRVAQLTNVTIFVAFIVVNAALVALRLTRPDTPRPFRVGAVCAVCR
ncbi:MAG: amino acid permease [Dehalococcoidia bacterium]|nr:amino acid permease [Dehalococcoidia bacterium]